MEDSDDRAVARPRFLNPLAIHLPVGAVASILHRLSGILLFLALLPAAWLLSLSVSGEAGFAAARAFLGLAGVRLFLGLLLWAFLHHFLAGIRFLLLDAGRGRDLAAARRLAWLVNLGAPLLALLWVLAGGWG
ncbi:MAG: succinate dehydrogenase, cytochrome b556 subunit [Gammaproteobacteria bacterium]|nr:MAG: succinate dehydrogenase, cytochrome b556 subunit [Gammaproteobacteria bacterium]